MKLWYMYKTWFGKIKGVAKLPLLKGDMRGASAIILSVMVSSSVLATIFYNQQNLQWALSSQADSKVKWSDHFVKKYGVTLGSYLVANNLVLCREAGWGDGDDNNKIRCKWNDGQPPQTVTPGQEQGQSDDSEPEEEPAPKEPKDFNLTTEEPLSITELDSEGNEITRKILRYKSNIQDDSINAGERVNFELRFDLVNWKKSAIKGLIGDIPPYICRTLDKRQVISGYCELPPTTDDADDEDEDEDEIKCRHSKGGIKIDDSVCDFIGEMDADYHIVLLTLQVLDKDDKPQGELAHAGIRRPFASVKVEVEDQPNCSLACIASNTPNDNPGCRGDFQPKVATENDPGAKLKLKITNEGPGVLYSLRLLRKQEPLPGEDNISTTYHLTSDIVKDKHDNFFLLPNGIMDFEDDIECNDTFQYSFTSSSTTRRQTRREQGQNPMTGREQESSTSTGSVNVHAQPYMTLSYTMGSFKNPLCLSQEENTEGEVVAGKVCSASPPAGKACITPNICRQATMEPNRGIFQGVKEIEAEKKTTTFTTIVRYVSPH